MFVLITLGTNDGLDCPLTHNGSRSVVTRFKFFTHFCDCSVKTQLSYRNICAKNSFNRFKVGAIVYRQFSTTFVLKRSSGQWTRSSEDWVSAFCECSHHFLSDFVPFTLWTVFTNRAPLFLQARGMTIVLLRISLHREKRVEHLTRILSCCPLIPMRCR